MEIVDYSANSFAIIGDTKEYKDGLKSLGGKYNPYLKINGGNVPGWIFSNKHRDNVLAHVNGEYDPIRVDKTPTLSRPSESSSSSRDKYQVVKFEVFKPYKNQRIYLYTYPEDDLKNPPYAVEAIVESVQYQNGYVKRFNVAYDNFESKGVAIISDGMWSLQYANFPNYFSHE